MTEAQDSRDVERAQVHNLAAAAAELLERAAAAPVGRTALTLLPGAGAPLKQTLLALGVVCTWPNMTRLGAAML
jgi:hypothetical protein